MCQGGGGRDMNVLEWGGRSVGFVRVGWREECGGVRGEGCECARVGGRSVVVRVRVGVGRG